MVVPAWALPVDECLRRHGTSSLAAGLTSEEVEARRQKCGFNELQKAPATPLWKLVLEQFNDTLVKVRRAGPSNRRWLAAAPPPPAGAACGCCRVWFALPGGRLLWPPAGP